jgi:hypothetical protein
LALNDVQAFDPPVGSQITIEVTLTNTGTVAGTFYVHMITSIVDVAGPDFGAIAGGVNFQGLDAIAATVDTTTNVAGRSGALGIVTLEGGASTPIQAITPPLDVVGTYDVGIQAGTFDTGANAIVEIQDTLIVENLIDIFEPAFAELSGPAVV